MDIALLKEKYKINDAQTHVEELESQISTAHTTGANISKLSTDLSYYAQLSNLTSSIQKSIKDIEDAKELLKTETDPEIIEMANEEIEQKEENISNVEEEIIGIKMERQFQDEDDDRAAILEIRAR